MKHIRMFENAQQAAAVLAELQYPTLSAIRGESGIALKPGVEPGPDYSEPFYIEDISGSANTVQIKKSSSGAVTLTIEKSIDGINWETMGTTSTTAITATVQANSKLYLRCSTDHWADVNYFNTITTTDICNVGGNVMSLIYGSNFTGNEITFPSESMYNLAQIFRSNTNIVSAYKLLLPATTLIRACYYCMFWGCSSLIMAPVLPATTLADYCYQAMFSGCTSLITAPELLASTMSYYCYSNMFYNCSQLNYIKCLATGTLNGISGWLQGVAATGTFVKAAGVIWPEGASGIPSGWTVQDAA